MTRQDVLALLKRTRFLVQREIPLQNEIAKVFSNNGIQYEVSYRLNDESIIDFFLPTILLGIEVKVKGRKIDIYKQCMRYSEFAEIQELVLFTNCAIGDFKLNFDKKLHIININRAWF